MTKSNRATRAPRILEETTPEPVAIAEIETQIALPRSVVGKKYKIRYKEAARERGSLGKAAKRSKWDWLAETLAGEVLNEKAKLKVDRFVAILEANGIADPLGRWPNRANGWEGRLRMTGGLVLRPMVAAAGVLLVPDEDGELEQLVPPAEWAARILG